MKITLEEILDIFATKGRSQYDREPVSQLEHGLQCATLAKAYGANVGLITACLLHDFGHLICGLGENSAKEAIGDRHEVEGAKHLQQLFPFSVTEPIALHVEAKRYLCAVDSVYRENLSPASQTSLVLQGGIYTKREALIFLAKPYAKDAIRLRLWDDLAKVENLKTPDLASFRPILGSCLRKAGDA
jgi:[1-hydroxy-2-(trimethylamino)ethyl]phosphonate dioxygenase